MKIIQTVIALAQLLFESRVRGFDELLRADIKPELKGAIRSVFEADTNDEAIARLLQSDDPDVRAAGGTLRWVQKSQEARQLAA